MTTCPQWERQTPPGWDVIAPTPRQHFLCDDKHVGADAPVRRGGDEVKCG